MTNATTTSTPPIRIVRLSHTRYRHADLATAKQFLLDFGLHVAYTENDGKKLYFAGQGREPYLYVAEEGPTSEFLGGTFLVETKEDLERASATLPGATALLPAGPTGGLLVTFSDPDGTPMNLVWGIGEKEVPTEDTATVTNYTILKPRKGEFQRFSKGACPVFKLGHYGHLVRDFEKSYAFFTTHFNLKATDILVAGPDFRVAAFMHVDREEEWVDHHTFFFSLNPIRTGVHHSSFEVHDPDVQAIGHDFLKKKGYQSAWGVGRHILGSQVFDYWYTPDEFLIEHYSDGDVVNCHTETGVLPAGDESLAIWGPAVPEGFMDAIPEKKKAVAAL